MKFVPLWFLFALAPAALADRPNILLICVDDLRPEIGAYGAGYIESPSMDRLASEGLLFERHYVHAPTCGASRYAFLTGNYGPSHNKAFFNRAGQIRENPEPVTPSLPAWFRQHGYATVAVGKVSHYPGGLGGPDWNDPDRPELPLSWDRSLMPAGPWKHPRGAMHGLAEGNIRTKPAEMDVYESFEGPDKSYPDGWITERTLAEMESLSKGSEPFFLAVGLIRPHLPFGAPAQYMEPYREAGLPAIPHPEKPRGVSTWHPSGEFRRYHLWDRDPNEDPAFAEAVRKHYAACVTYADSLIGEILQRVESLELEDNTIVVLWGDHGWHLGEHAVWGKHTLFEESLRSPLIFKLPDQIPHPGQMSQAIVESIDLFPTLCELAGLPLPADLDGTSLLPQIRNPTLEGGFAISYHGNHSTIVEDSHRLIVHGKGEYFELYDHRSPAGETRNVADAHPHLTGELLKLIQAHYPTAFE